MISINDLTTPLTKDQVKQSIYDVLAAVGVSTTSWKPGAVVRTMIAAIAIVIAAFSTLTASIARSGFLELATGQWLTLVAYYVYGVTRQEATFAPGEVTLSNASGNIYTLDPDDLVVSNPTTGKTYRNTATFTLNPGDTLTITIRAVESGSASTSTPGTITALETTLTGVTCANALAVVGLDEELDPALRLRCYEKLGALSPNGPWDAYASAARNALTEAGVSVGVTRVRVVKNAGTGTVTTYVATATGGVTGTVSDVSTDLGAVNDAIQRKAAPLAVTANTLSATVVTFPITYQAWVYNTVGLTDQELEDAIALALAAFFSAQPIGGNVIDPDPGKVFHDAIRRVIGAVRTEIFHVVVSLPAADTTLAISEVPALGAVNGTITQVAPGEGGF